MDEEIIERQFREKQEALAKEVRSGVGFGVGWFVVVGLLDGACIGRGRS